jgi:hypothetical protein
VLAGLCCYLFVQGVHWGLCVRDFARRWLWSEVSDRGVYRLMCKILQVVSGRQHTIWWGAPEDFLKGGAEAEASAYSR